MSEESVACVVSGRVQSGAAIRGCY